VRKVPAGGKARAMDRRSLRTRERLSWSLVDTIIEKGFEQARVQDVAARAKVGRSTFYAHFEDKDDAFLQHFIGFMQRFGQGLAWENGACRLPVRGLFEHLAEFRPLYDEMVKARRWDHTLKVGRTVLAEAFAGRLEQQRVSTGVPLPLVAEHIAGTLTLLMDWWLAHRQPHPPQAMDDYFHRLLARRTW
jgi:AcrR family transcriptional regulator